MTTIFITGASRGIGLAMASEFLRQGDQVIATARNPEGANKLQDLARQYPALALRIHKMDVGDQESVDRVAAEEEKIGGRVDVLINNAGIMPEEGDESIGDLDLAELEQAFSINVVGAARVTKAFLPFLRKSDRGRIVNVSSGAGSIADKSDSLYLCYAVSKAALNQLSRAMAAGLKPEGIIVVPITPGWVKTDMGGDKADLTAEESAASLVTTIKKLTLKQTGLFLDRLGRSGVYNW